MRVTEISLRVPSALSDVHKNKLKPLIDSSPVRLLARDEECLGSYPDHHRIRRFFSAVDLPTCFRLNRFTANLRKIGSGTRLSQAHGR